MRFMADVLPWERQAGESAAAFRAFRRYVALDPPLRTIRLSVGTPPGRRPPGCVERWAARHRWRERAALWDDEVYRIEDQQRLQAVGRTTGRA